MHEGVNGLLRDKSRPPGKAPIPPERVAEIVRLTQQAPPHEATHWTLRAMAKVAGVAAATVQAIWKAHGLSPHRWRHFKLSNDPAFAEKLTDTEAIGKGPAADYRRTRLRAALKDRRRTPLRSVQPTLRTGRNRHHLELAVRQMDGNIRFRAPDRRTARSPDPTCPPTRSLASARPSKPPAQCSTGDATWKPGAAMPARGTGGAVRPGAKPVCVR